MAAGEWKCAWRGEIGEKEQAGKVGGPGENLFKKQNKTSLQEPKFHLSKQPVNCMFFSFLVHSVANFAFFFPSRFFFFSSFFSSSPVSV